MPVVTYESLFLLDSTKVSADAEGVKGHLHATLERYGATISVSRAWDYNHKLAYPIENQKKGSYHIVYYTMESLKQAELERDLKINEAVLRHMTLKIDPKWEEAIMQIAREDSGTGFALRGMQEETVATTDPAALGVPSAEGSDMPAPVGGGGGYRGGRGRRPEGDKPE